MRFTEIPENRLYDDLACLWFLVSAPEDYAEEASHWREVLRGKLGPGRHHLLELGVGGGNNLSHLTAEFDATAVDLSGKMLANSRKLNPAVDHHVGDMRTVRLEREFDAVIIHDAVSYLLTEADLRATFETAAAHLRAGGVFVTSPDYTRESFRPDTRKHPRRSSANTSLAFVEYTFDSDPGDTRYETLMVYFIEEESELRVELDRHICGLFPDATWVQLMEECGFAVEKYPYDVHEDERQASLYVGIKD